MIKLPPRVVRLWWDAHSVAGVMAGLLLHVIFFAGAFALFVREAAPWEQPALRLEGAGVPADLDRVVAGWEQARGEPLPRYFNLFFGDTWQAGVKATWGERVAGTYIRHAVLLDAGDGTPRAEVADRGLIEFMVRLHCLDFFPGGIYLSGALGVIMLVAVATGLAIYLRRWWTDFYRFREARSRRVAWTDVHNVVGLLTLPFQTVLAFTGVFVAWSLFIYGSFAVSGFGGDFTALRAKLRPEEIELKPAGVPTPALPWNTLLERARTAAPEMDVEFLYVHHYGDANASVTIGGTTPRVMFKSGAVSLRMQDGAVLGVVDSVNPPLAQWILNAMAVLHFGTFGGWLLDAIYVVLSALTCLVCLSGLILWVEVRRARHPGGPPRWHAWFERASLGAAAGLFPATALLFATWHLLPASISERMPQAEGVFFGAWIVATLAALPVKNVRRSVRTLLWIAVAIAAAVPIGNGLGTGGWPGTVPLAASAVDLAAIGAAALGALMLTRHRPAKKPTRSGLL